MPNSTIYFQCLIGLQCKDFAIIAADQTNTQSIIVMKHDENKLYEVSKKLVMGAIGDPGDRVQFAQFIDKNVKLYKMKNGYDLSTAAAVHFARKTMMESLKTGGLFGGMKEAGGVDVAHDWSDYCQQSCAALALLGSRLVSVTLSDIHADDVATPSMVNVLVAGYDEVEGGQVYTVDFLACAMRVPFGVHGFGGLLSMGILDKYYKPELTELEAYELIKRCVREIHARLFISLPNFLVKVINKDGIKEMPIITPSVDTYANTGTSGSII